MMCQLGGRCCSMKKPMHQENSIFKKMGETESNELKYKDKLGVASSSFMSCFMQECGVGNSD